MKNLTRKRTLLLIAIGLFVIAIGQIIFRYTIDTKAYDFLLGAIEGLGIGLMIVALIKGSFKKTTST
ncbi:MAG: hypothetical protein WB492_04460 [Christiangramia sp.]